MVSKLFVGLLVGFALGGGLTFYGYANEIGEFSNEAIEEFGETVEIESSSSTETRSNVIEDCSQFDDLSPAWWDCSEHNRDITQNKHNERLLEEKLKIARGI